MLPTSAQLAENFRLCGNLALKTATDFEEYPIGLGASQDLPAETGGESIGIEVLVQADPQQAQASLQREDRSVVLGTPCRQRGSRNPADVDDGQLIQFHVQILGITWGGSVMVVSR